MLLTRQPIHRLRCANPYIYVRSVMPIESMILTVGVEMVLCARGLILVFLSWLTLI